MRKFLKPILTVAIMISFAISAFAAIDPADIVGIWTFDEGGGDTAGDSSENERDGVIVGEIDWVDGKSGHAIEFAGGHVEVEHDDGMDLETFSMVFWMKVPGVLAPYQMPIGKEIYPDRNYAMWLLPDLINLGIVDEGGADIQVAGGVVVDDNWHHVVGTYDMKFLRIYVDGVQTAERASTGVPNTTTAPLMIGSQPPDANGPLHGVIDEVALFRVALDEGEIQDIMEDGLDVFFAAVEPGHKLYSMWGALKSEY